MSGGHFDYQQYRLDDMANDIETVIYHNNSTELNAYGDRIGADLPDDIIEEFKHAVTLLREAAIYVQRIDWLLSGDDGEDSFRTRLKKDLETYRAISSNQKEY